MKYPHFLLVAVVAASLRMSPAAENPGIVAGSSIGKGSSKGSVFGADTGYPGPSPGKVVIELKEQTCTISNAALSLKFLVDEKGMPARIVEDGQNGQRIRLEGEVFKINLANGQSYVTSALIPDEEPRLRQIDPDPRASRLAARIPGQMVEFPWHTADGKLQGVWRALAHDNGNYVRQELEVSSADESLAIKECVWLNQPIAEARTAGQVDGSPVVAGNFFLGCEDPMALNLVQNAGHDVICKMPRNATLAPGEKWRQSFVIGVAPASQLRRAFLYYLERERAHPYRPFLHYNSWYDIAWHPFALNETNCLEAIRLFGERFIQGQGVDMDALVFDDGWDDPKTLWQFHRGFPVGFTPLAKLCQQYHTRLGVWLSPFGGYGEPKNQRLKFGGEQGYETNATGFSLAGPKYYSAFKRACVEMIRKYGVNHFKFDGIASGMYANGGADYIRDTDAMRRLMLELRQEDPNLYINLTTGSWPSPFWLRFADSLWRQGGDMGLAGKGNHQQQWLTYRDQETRRNIVGKGPLYPLNSLMSQGVAYSRSGSAGDPAFNSAGFKDDVRAFFGSGTGLQELYIQPGKLTAGDWQVLAEAAKWSRANADVLVDTHWIGGDPSKLEIYGYASWSLRKGIVMLRNPNDAPQEFTLEAGHVFELPPGSATRYTLKSAWTEDAKKDTLILEANKPLKVKMQPFEILVWDANPRK